MKLCKIIYSTLFARFAWMVTPRNMLLLACHLTNLTLQVNLIAKFCEIRILCGCSQIESGKRGKRLSFLCSRLGRRFDFMGRRPLSAGDHSDPIKDCTQLRNHVRGGIRSMKSRKFYQYFRSNFATQGSAQTFDILFDNQEPSFIDSKQSLTEKGRRPMKS